jgi:hypothetical protein
MTFGEKIKLFFSSIGDFLTPFIKIFLSSAGAILAEIAMKTVQNVAVDPKILTNDDKRKEAFSMIKGELAQRGITMASSMIYAAIEAAVQKLKAPVI